MEVWLVPDWSFSGNILGMYICIYVHSQYALYLFLMYMYICMSVSTCDCMCMSYDHPCLQSEVHVHRYWTIFLFSGNFNWTSYPQAHNWSRPEESHCSLHPQQKTEALRGVSTKSFWACLSNQWATSTADDSHRIQTTKLLWPMVSSEGISSLWPPQSLVFWTPYIVKLKKINF